MSPTQVSKWSLNIKCPRPWNTGPYPLSSPKISALVILISTKRKWFLIKNPPVPAFVWDHNLTTGNWRLNVSCDLSSTVIRPNCKKLRLTRSLCFIPIQTNAKTSIYQSLHQSFHRRALSQKWFSSGRRTTLKWGSVFRLSILSVVAGKLLSSFQNRWQKSRT